jgi:hypothetical protein
MMPVKLENIVYVASACLVLVTGCSEKGSETLPPPPVAPAAQTTAALDLNASAPAPVTPPNQSAAPAAPSAPVATAIAGTEVSADSQQALAQLNGILTGTFLAEIGRPPKSVNEFVERGLIRQLPKAPDGKKFFYDAQKNQIVLADRQPGDVDPAPLTAEQAQKAYMQTAAEIHKRIGQ